MPPPWHDGSSRICQPAAERGLLFGSWGPAGPRMYVTLVTQYDITLASRHHLRHSHGYDTNDTTAGVASAWSDLTAALEKSIDHTW